MKSRVVRLAAALTAAAATAALATTAAATTTPATTSGSDTTTATSGADTSAAAGTADAAAWDEVVAAAEEEGSVVMYSVMVPDINDRLSAAFAEAYPEIDIEIIRVLGNEIDAKLDAEKETGAAGADIVANVNYPYTISASESGDLLPIVGPDATSPSWAGTDYVINDDVQLVTFRNIGLGWNTEEFPEGGPTSFEDLLDPKYADGRIGLTDPIAPVVADFYATLEDNYGPEFLEQLAAQEPVFFPGAVPLEQALAAGEITVGGYVTNVGIEAAKASGAPVEFALPENAWAPPIMAYIPAWVERPNAAQVLLNFMASPEGQEVLGLNSFSPLPDIPGTFAPIETVTVANVQRSIEPGWYDEYYARWKTIFGR